MTAEKLKRQMVREIKAKPVKAVILGVSLLVASYFWVPLLLGRSGVDATTQSPTIAVAATVADQPQQKRTTAEQSAAFSWRQLDSWMNADRMMTATSHIGLVRNPFASSLFADEKKSTEPSGSGLTSRESTPDDLHLVLTSTVVGNGRATALISGKAYKVGQRIEKMAGGTMLAFTLAEIHPRRVILERGEYRYELRLSQTSMAGVVMFKRAVDENLP